MFHNDESRHLICKVGRAKTVFLWFRIYVFITYTAKGVSCFLVYFTGSREPIIRMRVNRLTLFLYADCSIFYIYTLGLSESYFIMALIQCNECGQSVSDKAANCPNCGAPLSSTENKEAILKLVWKGKYAVTKTSMEVVVNGKSLGLYSYNDGFELDIPIQSSFMDIALRCNGMTFHIKLPIESQEKYTCKLYYSAFSYFYYELYNSTGHLMKKDKLGIGMWILCFLIPLVGFIYFFVKKNEYPSKAKSALLISIVGFIIAILQMYIL